MMMILKTTPKMIQKKIPDKIHWLFPPPIPIDILSEFDVSKNEVTETQLTLSKYVD